MKIRHCLAIFIALILLQSCYTITMINKDGVPMPDPFNDEAGAFFNKEVIVMDTVVKLNLIQNKVMAIERCPSGAFYAVEYRPTLGGLLLNTITFGKRKQIKVRYVCTKP